MKRTSGRIGVGLVLVSMLVGACLTDREKSDAVGEAVTRPEAMLPDALEAKEVVFAVRSQIERAFGKTNVQIAGTNVYRGLVNPFDDVGARTRPAVEFLTMKGAMGEVGKVAADVVLPAQADGAFRLRDARSGVSIEVGLVGATKSAREDADGYTVYRAGYDKGAHIVHRTTSQGTEDYVFFPNELPDTPELRYELALGENVAGLRLVEQTLEMLDAGGAPRLRMAPPYAVDGDGRRIALNVAIEGCAYDSSWELPWDRPIVSPGATHCTVHLTWDSNARAPLTVDPAWVLTGEMSVPRLNATSMEVPGSKSRVIVVGGDPGDIAMAHKTTEVFDENSNTWSMYKPMVDARTQHAMVQVMDANTGSLVVVGGRNANGIIAKTETMAFDGSGWQPLGTTEMTTSRALHTATAIEGGRILVAGGVNAGGALKSMEVYLPWTAKWEPMPSTLSSERIGHTATLGKSASWVLIAGGKKDTAGLALSTIDYCNATTDIPTCSQYQQMLTHGRANHKAVREVLPQPALPRIFFVGGESGANKVLDVDIYDGQNGSITAGQFPHLKGHSTFDALLINGSPIVGGGSKLVITGGYDQTNEAGKSTEWLDTSGTVDVLKNRAWQAGPNMLTGRAAHTMAALTNGRILVIGGAKAGAGSSEVLQCSANSDCPSDRFCVDGFCCDTECKGICEACNSAAPGHTPGTCFPIAGTPREGHGECVAGDGTGDDANCAGKCGGFDRETCDFPVGKPCATECAAGEDTPQSSSKSLTCSVKGICDVVGFETSCGNLTCAADGKTCNIKCTPDGGCIKGYECNVTSGSCTEAQVKCSTRTNEDGSEREVIESVADASVIVRECGAFKCDTVKSDCHTFCRTAYDCVDGFTCDTNKECVAKDFENTVEEVTGCSTSPTRESSRFGWLAALAIAGAVAARRNRARA